MAKSQTVLERLKALDAERAKLMEGAKGEAMGMVDAALKELNALGFNYIVALKAVREDGEEISS